MPYDIAHDVEIATSTPIVGPPPGGPSHRRAIAVELDLYLVENLSRTELAIYIWLRAKWNGSGGPWRGHLSEIHRSIGASKNGVTPALKALQARGLIEYSPPVPLRKSSPGDFVEHSHTPALIRVKSPDELKYIWVPDRQIPDERKHMGPPANATSRPAANPSEPPPHRVPENTPPPGEVRDTVSLDRAHPPASAGIPVSPKGALSTARSESSSGEGGGSNTTAPHPTPIDSVDLPAVQRALRAQLWPAWPTFAEDWINLARDRHRGTSTEDVIKTIEGYAKSWNQHCPHLPCPGKLRSFEGKFFVPAPGRFWETPPKRAQISVASEAKPESPRPPERPVVGASELQDDWRRVVTSILASSPDEKYAQLVRMWLVDPQSVAPIAIHAESLKLSVKNPLYVDAIQRRFQDRILCAYAELGQSLTKIICEVPK